MKHLLIGLIAGAAGTTALNLVGYLDMLIRGRAPSSLPSELAGEISQRAGLPLGSVNESDKVEHRKEALGAIMGMEVGLTIGGTLPLINALLSGAPTFIRALVVGGLAMAATDIPATRLGKTNPGEWGISGWISDIVPHVAYGLVTVATYDAIMSAWRER